MTIYDLRMMYREAPEEKILEAYDKMDTETIDTGRGDRTLLHTAAALADPEAVRLLLEKGISANAKDRYGNFPLHALASLEYVRDCRPGGVTEEAVRACADLLFDAGASVMRKNEDGIPALYEAARFARYEIIESAIEHGAKLTMTDRDGNNPLHVACDWAGHPINYIDRGHSIGEAEQREGYLRCIRALADAGLDTDEKNDFGQTAIDIAIESGVKEAAAIITGDDSMAATGGMTVFKAIEKNDIASLDALIGIGIDLEESADDGMFTGMTPLAAACMTLNLEAVRRLLEGGADPDFKNADGETCLTKLLKAGDSAGDLFWRKNDGKICKDLLKLLWSAGMEKDGRINDYSDTALTLACKKSFNDGQMNYCFAVELVEGGCNINLSDLNGVTPLMLICQMSDETDFQVSLLEAGADLDAVDKNGNTPLHYTARNKSYNTAKEMAEMLFDFGFDNVSAVNNDGKTALEIASDMNNEPLVKLILLRS